MIKLINRLCDNFTRLLFIWVIAAAAIGCIFPSAFTSLRPYMEWLFALTMLGIGAVLNLDDFKPVIKRPQTVLIGTLAQFAIMPALGFFVAMALRLPPELAVGVIITGAAPGAMASNVISYLAKADVAYSIAVTSLSTFLAPLLTPFFIYLFAHTFIKIEFWPMFFSIIKIVILPLIAGLLLKHYFRKRVEGLVNIFPAASTLFIAFICGLVVALNRDYLAGMSMIVFVAVFFHNAFGLAFGYGAGVLYRFDRKRRRTLSFEVGMQNAGLGAVLALKHFSAQAALPNALFAIWCIVTASILAEFWSRRP